MGGASWECLWVTGDAEDREEGRGGEGTREGWTMASDKLSVTTVGEPGSELLFTNNPLLTDFGDVLGDLSTTIVRTLLFLEATHSSFETRA